MKKLVAILLLSVHLFYLGGYTLAFQYFMSRSDDQLVSQLNGSGANSAKLIKLKIPVHMPTLDDWTDYANIQGQVQVKDAYYNYVRLKMTKDTLYLICLPNTVKANLAKANIIMTKNLNDIPLNKKGPNNSSTKKAESTYDHYYQVVKCDYAPLAKLVKTDARSEIAHLSNPYIESPGKPPNAAC
ncbi:MAG: hypothetical protein JO080_12135 [Mucilaginibacter sp.]|nr:hypothetical protein [Mucilaginibacter sp.]